MLSKEDVDRIGSKIYTDPKRFAEIAKCKTELQNEIVDSLTCEEIEDIQFSRKNEGVIEKLIELAASKYLEREDEDNLFDLCISVGTIIKEYEWGDYYARTIGVGQTSIRIIELASGMNNIDNNSNRYKHFKLSMPIAVEYYNSVSCDNYLSSFWQSFAAFCSQQGVEYTKEYSGSNINISIGSVIIVIIMKNKRPYVISIYSLGGQLIQTIRSLIWDTKTFFGLPVLNVTSFDDYFATYPQKFQITIIPEEFALENPHFNW